ncbi:hypothetical protein [Nocardiopsis sp. NPDC006938]|uniref:hypothetical protein n=1 Tax=Nocardiopsis sp. NPDC006938 TaxID=3364337 RepID=UPI0036C4CF05
MTHRPAEQPSETAALRKRLNRLEAEFDKHTLQEARARAVTAGLSSGAVALFLSMSLPWVRSGTEARYSARTDAPTGDWWKSDSSLWLGGDQSVATGWELFGAGVMPLFFFSVAVLGVLAVLGLFVEARGLSLSTAWFSVVPVLLAPVTWPVYARTTSMEAGPGVTVALVACLVVAVAAYRASHDGQTRSV